ncbi:FimV/HubP family polar landmark protein [Neopusillimonas maritima]|uniref:FimV N-terminal domain-containing protein n=1 Tax=Neopusillimonas maritima TaxID=2026239 RepID=A0A3A1YQZ2_9BURK|nr:FimV/HubP family polar landmark protein [Neopusillimonas maritima]RIY39608.1 hypothetical protein CJP73_13415 [Neopusillimonas maritima]
MNDSCRVTVKPLAVRLAYLTALASLAVSSSVYAISFGHSRLLSPVGQPLQIQVPVHALTDQERDSLVVSVAAAPAWEQAGLTPPVDPATMQVAVVDGVRAGSKLITVRSSQPLSSSVADLLLAVRSSSGQMQHQVSLLAPADLEVARASGGVTASGSGAVGTPGDAAATSIQIRRGDTLFALARRHAVPGISVYQWMIGVMQANPQAFINDNVNLIKAGATLNVPGGQQLAALSDREAREIFQKHATAFAEYRQRLAGEVARAEPATTQATDRGEVTAPEVGSAPAPAPQQQDRLVLQSAQASTTAANSPSANSSSVANAGGQNGSGGSTAPANSGAAGSSAASVSSDDQLALERNTEEARQRVNQLEDNVKNLNQALQQQGTAAHQAMVDGAKTVEETVEQLKEMVDGEMSGSDTAAANNGRNDNAPETDQNKSVVTSGSDRSTSPANAGIGTNAGINADADADANAGISADTNAGTSTLTEGSSGALAGNTSSAAQAQSANKPSGTEAAASVEDADKDSDSLSTWFMNNLLIVISGALALIVLIVAWLLRRVGAERDDDSDAVITEEMVRERLQSINLDLDDSTQTGQTEKRR